MTFLTVPFTQQGFIENTVVSPGKVNVIVNPRW